MLTFRPSKGQGTMICCNMRNHLYSNTVLFRLTNVIPERIIFVSRGITVYEKKKRTVSQDGYLQELNRDARSTKQKQTPLPPTTAKASL